MQGRLRPPEWEAMAVKAQLLPQAATGRPETPLEGRGGIVRTHVFEIDRQHLLVLLGTPLCENLPKAVLDTPESWNGQQFLPQRVGLTFHVEARPVVKFGLSWFLKVLAALKAL